MTIDDSSTKGEVFLKNSSNDPNKFLEFFFIQKAFNLTKPLKYKKVCQKGHKNITV